MPNAKKKKAAKNEDFKKKKLKVGKAKALPDNYTDTSFTSKSISLPNQSITEDKSKEITTGRNLTLTDLLTQLKHYNAGVKKEALSGLQELFGRHPDMLRSSLNTVVNGIVKLFIDDSYEVRKALIKFLNETFIHVDKIELEPFVPLLIIYTCSAMTHIMEDIRLDAIKMMDIWVNIVPEAITGKFWKRISDNFISLLAVGSNSINVSTSTSSNPITSSSVKAQAAVSHLHINKTKLELLTSLAKFFEAGLFEDRQDTYWFMYNFLSDRHAKKSFRRKFDLENKEQTPTIPWNPPSALTFTPESVMRSSVIPYLSGGKVPISYNSLNLFEATGSNVGQEKAKDKKKDDKKQQHISDFSFQDRVSQVKEFIETFQPVLVGNWLESAPAVFTSSNVITYSPALQMLHTVLHLSLVLWRAMVSGGSIQDTSSQWLDTHLQQLLKHLSVYFPYGLSALGNGGPKVESLLQEMNIMTCELTSLFLLARKIQKNQESGATPLTLHHNGKKRPFSEMDQENEVPNWADRIVDYVLGLLGFHELDTKVDGKMTSMSTEFKNENLVALLPAIWGFLNCLDGDRQFHVFQSFIKFSQRYCHSHSASKRTSLAFIIRVYLVQSMPSYNGRFRIEKKTAYAELMNEWLLGLPRLLWELKTQHIGTTQLILNVMCDIAKRGDKDIFDTETLSKTALTMTPFFFTVIASKGDTYGPFIHLPKELQKRALEFMYYIDVDVEKVKTALLKCKSHEAVTSEVSSWII